MNDPKLQQMLSRVMLAGVLAAAAVMAVGLAWYLPAHPGRHAGDHVFTGEPLYLRSPSAILGRALHLEAPAHRESLIQLGVLLLLLNPLLRLILAAAGYFGQRDLLYAFSSLLVLAILLLSFFL